MPEQEQPGLPEPVLSQDPLVEQLLPDPSQGHPNVRVLAGFLGNSVQEGHVRLYLTPTLDTYLEIPRQAVVQSQSLVSDQNPLGGTLLWVKQDADVVLHTRTNLRQRQEQFLRGNLSQATMRGIAGGETINPTVFTPGGVQTITPVATIGSFIICPTFIVCYTTPVCPIGDIRPGEPVE